MDFVILTQVGDWLRNKAKARPIGIAAGNKTSHLILFNKTFDSTLMRGHRTGSPVNIPTQ